MSDWAVRACARKVCLQSQPLTHGALWASFWPLMFLESCCFSPHNVPKGEKKCYIMPNESNGLYHVPRCIINSLCLFHLKLLCTHCGQVHTFAFLTPYRIKTPLALLSLLDHMGVLHLHSRYTAVLNMTLRFHTSSQISLHLEFHSLAVLYNKHKWQLHLNLVWPNKPAVLSPVCS